MENCIFCKIIKEGSRLKVWENDKYLAFLDIRPVEPGHTLLVPKKHSDYIFDLPDDEYCELMIAAKKIAKLLKEKLNPKRIGMVVEGFGVSHVHIHLIPINNPYELNPEKAKSATEDELKKVLKKILN